MIGTAVKELLLEKQETFLVPAENVANVMCLKGKNCKKSCFRKSKTAFLLYFAKR